MQMVTNCASIVRFKTTCKKCNILKKNIYQKENICQKAVHFFLEHLMYGKKPCLPVGTDPTALSHKTRKNSEVSI